ncbi:VCBS domain-containing protein, partial [Mesorhizobium australicum]|uniref:VCBS domain-containing protein n=1 Tax=Mesorhizobium australicum TaxID=536018 RepID=UPI003336E841
GEHKIETFSFDVLDGNGGIVSRTVSVDIAGTNDAPTIAVVDVTGAVTEDAAATLTDSGSVTFTEVDATDIISSSAALTGTATSGPAIPAGLATALGTALSISQTGSNDGTIGWDFALNNSLAQYLAAGETVTATYTITVKDDSGTGNDTATQAVTVVITGVTSEPIIINVGDSEIGGSGSSGSIGTTGIAATSVDGAAGTGGTGGIGTQGGNANAVFLTQHVDGAGGDDSLAAYAHSFGGAGGSGGSGGAGGQYYFQSSQTGSSFGSYYSSYTYSYQYSAGGSGGAGGAGGSAGGAVCTIYNLELVGYQGDDDLQLILTAQGGNGGTGGNGGNGIYGGLSGYYGSNYENYYTDYHSYGYWYDYYYNYYYSGGKGGNGGDGGAGGDGGDAISDSGNSTLLGGANNDTLSILLNVVGGTGGHGGNGSYGGQGGSSTIAEGGHGGSGGHGGNATGTVVGNELSGDAGNDSLEIQVSVQGGAGGVGGDGGTAGTHYNTNSTYYYNNYYGYGGYNYQHYDTSYGRSGDGGHGGIGGNASVVIDANNMLGGSGDDTLVIDVDAVAGTGGSGGSPGYAGSTFTSGYNSFYVGVLGTAGVAGAAGSVSVSITDNVVDGGAGNDTLKLEVAAPAGATIDISDNIFDGGADHNTFDFSGLLIGSGVTLDLAAQTLTIAGGVNGVSNIEQVIGSQYADHIAGSSASETFNGGAGADTFAFASGFGHDTIVGFVAGPGAVDVIEFASSLFADFSEVMDNAADNGSDTVITFDGDNSLILKNVLVSQLSFDDFHFV